MTTNDFVLGPIKLQSSTRDVSNKHPAHVKIRKPVKPVRGFCAAALSNINVVLLNESACTVGDRGA